MRSRAREGIALLLPGDFTADLGLLDTVNVDPEVVFTRLRRNLPNEAYRAGPLDRGLHLRFLIMAGRATLGAITVIKGARGPLDPVRVSSRDDRPASIDRLL